MHRPDLLKRGFVGLDLTIYMMFTHAPRDQLVILPAEVQHQNKLMVSILILLSLFLYSLYKIIMPQSTNFGKHFPLFPAFRQDYGFACKYSGKFMHKALQSGAYCGMQNILERVYDFMDRKLLIAVLLLPATVLFSGVALAAGLTSETPAAGVPAAYAVEAETCVDTD